MADLIDPGPGLALGDLNPSWRRTPGVPSLLLEQQHPMPERAENASLQVTGLAAGTVTGRVIAAWASVPPSDCSSRTPVGVRR